MHVIIVTPTFFPIRGGAEQTVYEWIRNNKAPDVRFSILTFHIKGSAFEEIMDKNISVYRIRRHFFRILGPLTNYIKVFLKLREIYKKDPFQIVHLGHVFLMGLGVVFFKKALKIPYINSPFGWDTYDPINPIKKSRFPLLAYIMNNADYVATMSQHMKRSAQIQGCKKDIKVIPGGASVMYQETTINIRDTHVIPENNNICFSMQRLHPRKGLRYLLEAIPSILKHHPNTTFIIAGRGEEEEFLKNLAKKMKLDQYIIWTGFINDTDLASYYDQADLFLLPTLFEGFGLVYVDALSKGTPIVTTNSGGAVDIVTSDKIGYLVPPEDAQSFADAVIKALKKEWDRQYIKDYAKRYDWTKISDQYMEIYKSLVKSL